MDAILGTWDIDPTSIDENQGKVMDAMGTPKEYQEMMLKMKPRLTYSKNGDKWKVIVDGADGGPILREIEAKLGEIVNVVTPDGRKSEVSMVWKDGAMHEKTVIGDVEALSIREPKGKILNCKITIPSQNISTSVVFQKSA